MAPSTNTRIVRAKYVARGDSFTHENFRTETVPLDHNLKEGDVLIRNIYLALDPYTRFSFESPAPTLGQTVVGYGLGEVVESKNAAYPVSSIVVGHNFGWEQYTLQSNPRVLFVVPDAQNSKVDLTEFVNALGMNGLTAYAAAETLAKFHKDQKIYVSSAAGPVGTLFALLAKRAGAFVIGSAGSDDKVQYLLKDIGLDAAFNYKTQDTRAQLDAAAPDGIDIYFDLVGGETLDIALEKLKNSGKVIAVGNLSVVNGKTPYLTKNLHLIVLKALTINGFSTFPHYQKFPEFWRKFVPLVASGEFKTQKPTVIQGLENAGQAYADYFDGKYKGKVAVQVSAV
ncbi:hypothetical protein BGZ68_004413 [Mortierella alpina]|nr:hypothetical protein BGZ68_004413 [Mortierella alpina]